MRTHDNNNQASDSVAINIGSNSQSSQILELSLQDRNIQLSRNETFLSHSLEPSSLQSTASMNTMSSGTGSNRTISGGESQSHMSLDIYSSQNITP